MESQESRGEISPLKPRELRRLPEADAIRHWSGLARSDNGLTGASQYLKIDVIWVEVEIPHALYDADWNTDALSSSQIALATEYAQRPGPLPPGMASFRSGRGTVCVIDGNHRAHASYLRGDRTARFYMPACEWELFLAELGDT